MTGIRLRHNETRAVSQGPPQHDEVAMLLARCAQADGDAFRRLYDSQSSLLYAVAMRITRDTALASDAVHDAMLQVWRNAARFDPARGSARAWLASLVRYRALDAIGRTQREVLGAEMPWRWTGCKAAGKAKHCTAASKRSRPSAAAW